MTDQPNDVSTALEVARAAVRDAVSASAEQPGTDLLPVGADSAVAVKAQLAAARARIVTARKTALSAQESAKVAIRAQQAELQRAMDAMNTELEPLLTQVRMLEEGIWTMNLYLGRDEELHVLTEGAPAPAGTPVHVRQQVLAMDEESALYAGDGGMDVRDIEAFERWITADPAHLDQVLPEQRGVVAIIPRRQGRDYKDPWLQNAMDQANAQTWWLIRNGENLYRMLTDFHVGKRLVPARNEFTSMFLDTYTKKPLEPGSSAWLKAEKSAGARERHYMRIALILQGLVDRTAVFHPLPVAGLSLLSPEHYDAGHVVLIADDENQLTTGRKPFYTWLAEKNHQLTPGMRVVITTHHRDWPSASGDHWNYGYHERLWPNGVESPKIGEVYTIARRGDAPGSLTFTYARTVETWVRDEYTGRDELRAPKTKGSCTILPDDRFVLPVDLVTVAEMRDYLNARTERHAYSDLFPVLNAAIAFKEAEAAAEAPFRRLLASQVAQTEGIDLDVAEAAVGELVDWWKVGNRWHRPLNGEPVAEAKAAKAILTERARLARAGGNDDKDARVVARIRATHPNALLVARRKDGTYVALTPHARRWALPTDTEHNQYRDQVAPLDVWVTRHDFTTTGKAKAVQEWVIPAPATVSRWISLYEAGAWASWNRRAVAADHLSDPEIAAGAAELTAITPDGWVAIAVLYQEDTRRGSDDGFEVYAYRPDATPRASDQPLTKARTRLAVGRFTSGWKRERDGSVTLQPRIHRSDIDVSGGSYQWSDRRPYGGEEFMPFAQRKDGQLSAPWQGDRRAVHVVRFDEAAFDEAHAQAVAGAQIALAVSALAQVVHDMTRALADDAVTQATAAAKARFLEDYLDEALWEDHAKALKLAAPWTRSPAVKGYDGVEGGLRRLTARLVETGRHPYGLTVGEAMRVLGEPVEDRPEYGHQSGHPVTFPDDVLALHYPEPPQNAGLLEGA